LSELPGSAFIFPAFVHAYPEDLFQGLQGVEPVFFTLLKTAGTHLNNDLSRFSVPSCTFLGNELFTQYITYCYSCSLIQYFNSKDCNSRFSAGYSMGIYATLVNAGVISFTDGLDLITNAFASILSCIGKEKCGMGSIIGLNREDINEQITKNNLKVEITNRNSEFAFVLSGTLKELDFLFERVSEEGALHVRKMNTSIPYHSSILNNCSDDFSQFAETVPFNKSKRLIISLIDQQILDNPVQLREEVIRNLFTPLDWYHTQLVLIESGVTEFVECGIDKGLTKNSKFIDGNISFISPAAFNRRLK
jgi:[acyl-carrier-protein] S-malonyltransferase